VQVLASLGIAWVGSRLVHLGAYVAGLGRLRIAAWMVGVGLILARFGVAVRV